jgi:hypothetical protein
MSCQTLCHVPFLPVTTWSYDRKRPTKTREEPSRYYQAKYL